MKIKSLLLVLFLYNFLTAQVYSYDFTMSKDTRAKNLKYQYDRMKEDEKYRMESKMLNLTPSGYMTVQEYEELSAYKEKSDIEIETPKINKPSDFEYVPKPTYKLVRYNDPPGGVELTLGQKLFKQRQVNAQGIASPDFSKLVYSAVYYYSDSASVAADLFVIPLDESEYSNLNKILKASTVKREANPILSTDKVIDNYATFRTLTPVDFSTDGTKLLVKEKIGSSEDGIWQTLMFVYDFNNRTSYDLFVLRDAIKYFWKEYMSLKLEDRRWDIYPLGFDANNPDRVVAQAYAFTGDKPVFLGTWSIDWQGEQSRLVSFDKDYEPKISENGFKLVKDGVQSYNVTKKEEKSTKKQNEILKKQQKQEEKDKIKEIKLEYKYGMKGLSIDYKDSCKDLRKLRSLSGNIDSSEVQDAYNKYLIDQLNKDINKGEKLLDKKQKELDKLEQNLDKLYQTSGNSSKADIIDNTND